VVQVAWGIIYPLVPGRWHGRGVGKAVRGVRGRVNQRMEKAQQKEGTRNPATGKVDQVGRRGVVGRNA